MKAIRKFMRAVVVALALSSYSPAIYAAADIQVNPDAGYAYNGKGGFVPLDAPAGVNASFYDGSWSGFDLNSPGALNGWTDTDELTSLNPHGLYCACECPLPADPSVPEVQPPSEPAAGPDAEPSMDPAALPAMEPAADPVMAPSTTVSQTAASPAMHPTTGPADAPAVDPAADPVMAPSTTPAPEPTMEPAASPAMDPTSSSNGPANDPAATPATGPASGPATGPASGPATGPASGPATGPASGPATGPASGPATGPASGPATGPASGPATGPAPSSRRRVLLQASGPAPGPASGPATEPASEPSSSPATGPVSEPSSGPVSQPSSGPVSQPSSGPVSQPSSAPEPSSSPMSGPAAGPAMQPAAELAAEPAAEPAMGPVMPTEPASAPTVGPEAVPDAEMDPTSQPAMDPATVPSIIPTAAPALPAPPPPVCYCPCPPAPPPAPPPPSDPAALCASNPNAEGCQETAAEDSEANIQYAWVISQVQEQECTANTDRFGFCGNESATVILALVCQKQAVSADGSVQVLIPYVEQATLSDSPANYCTDERRPADNRRTFSCAERQCEELEIQSRVVSDCFSLAGLECGEKHKIVERLCYSSTISELVPLSEQLLGTPCENLTGSSELMACDDTVACPAFFYQYEPWQPCSQQCNTTTCPTSQQMCALDGQQDRAFTCSRLVSNAVTAASASDCVNLALDDRRDCAKKCFNPLLRFTKTDGECVHADDTQCGVDGTMSVEYAACQAGPGCQRWADVTSAQVTTTSCPAILCDPCAAVTCSDPGTASYMPMNGKCICTCNTGYTGSRCHVEEGVTYTVRSVDGSECTSGVLDIDGTCCTDGVDGCGYCAGMAVTAMGSTRVGYDIDGVCCNGDTGVFLTTGLTCCPSIGDLDECGVCGGSSDTCSKAVSSTLALTSGYSTGAFVAALKTLFPGDVAAAIVDDSASARRRLQQTTNADAVVTLQHGFSTSVSELTAAFVRTGIAENNGGNLGAPPATPQATMQGVAGNGVCETGEVPGSEDCPQPQSCPMPTAMDDGEIIGNAASQCAGIGVCIRASGICKCPLGYIGEACDRCNATGQYAAVPTASGNACTRLAQDFVQSPTPAAPTDSTPTGSTPTGSTPSDTPPLEVDEDGGMSTGVIVGIVVGAVGGVAIMVGIVYYVLRIRGAKEVSPV